MGILSKVCRNFLLKIFVKGAFTMLNIEEMINVNGDTPESAVEFTLNFEPQTEQELIEFANWLISREHQSVIKSRWTLGQKINQSGDTVYGENTAGRISEEVGYSESTIQKSRKFARIYSNSQIDTLLHGPFSLSWRDVAQNLSVPPEDFLRTYNESRNREEFRNAVTEFRRTRTTQSRTQREPRRTRAQLEAENTELRTRISELDTENAELQARIKELEGQLEVAEADIDSVEKTKLAEELSS
jgi:hypothetical protein